MTSSKYATPAGQIRTSGPEKTRGLCVDSSCCWSGGGLAGCRSFPGDFEHDVATKSLFVRLVIKCDQAKWQWNKPQRVSICLIFQYLDRSYWNLTLWRHGRMGIRMRRHDYPKMIQICIFFSRRTARTEGATLELTICSKSKYWFLLWGKWWWIGEILWTLKWNADLKLWFVDEPRLRNVQDYFC